jgi:hypothetical protein
MGKGWIHASAGMSGWRGSCPSAVFFTGSFAAMPGDDTSTALARISVVSYDFRKKNTNAEKGELT